ncbi:hypothetical protein [Arthrobacter sp. ISL-69]|uniref:hypothetical protein n=1 Tax=Arthrobacter sp. ISL-69 TaxID=2819113 RepID=UPI001BEAAE12|nr:hypothetical protein [Arthrobacter sp. ISL-69]MBT2537190.1 hypothetical protein [Arthrobacter sp. ISL-69]
MANIPTITAWDLNTNTLLTHLRASQPTYSVRMNDAGEFNLQINLTDAQAAKQAAVILALEGIPFKVVFSQGTDSIQYTGIAWNTNMSSKSTHLTIAGKALPSYFTQVVATKSYDTTISPANLLASVINDTQNQPGANMRLTPRLALNSPPAPITPSYTVNQYVTAAQIIADATAAITPGTGGVDYYITDTFVNGAPVHTFNIAAPRCGRDKSVSQASIDLTQTIDWNWPRNASQSGNQAIVVGAGSGGVQPKSIKNSTKPRGGLGQAPLLQMVYQFNRLSTQPELDAQANGLIQMFGQPVTVPVITLPVDYAPLPLGSFIIGDDVRVYSPPSPWFPQGLDQWWRIAAYTVTYPDEGVPTYQLTLNRPPVY